MIYYRLCLNSISMNIVINAGGYELECIETHPPIYGMEMNY